MKSTFLRPLNIIVVLFLINLQLFAQINLSNGLVADYPFDGNTNDLSGFNNNGTSTGVSYGIDKNGIFGSVINLPSQHVVLPQNIYAGGDFTVSCWLKVNSFGIYPRIFDFGSPWSFPSSYGIRGRLGAGSGEIAFEIMNTSTTDVGFGVIGNKSLTLNTWNHVVYKLEGNLMKILLNGEIIANSTILGFPVTTAGTYTTNNINKSNRSVGGDTQMNAAFDDFKIYNRSLSDCEAMALYNSSFTGLSTPILILNNNVLSSSLSTFSGANYLWTYNGNTVSGINTNTFTGTLNAGAYTGITKYGSCSVVSLPFVLTAQIANINTGLKAYYPFNENANDLSGNGNHGTLSGANAITYPTITGDRFLNNSAYQFDGNDELKINNQKFLNGSKSVTINTWIKFKNNSGLREIISAADGRSICSCDPIVFGLQGNQLYAVYASVSGTNQTFLNIPLTSYPFQEDKWYMITSQLIDNNSTSQLLVKVNNKLVVSTSGANIALNYDTNMDTYLGSISNAPVSGPQQFWNGGIDNLRVYDRSINDLELTQLYNEYCDVYFAQQPLATLTGTTLSVNTYGGASYQWSFNNLSVSGATSPVYSGTKSAGLYTVTVTNNACVASASVTLNSDIVDLNNGLKAYYPFNNNAFDESLNGHNGTALGASLTTNRFLSDNTAYNFNGVNNVITFTGVPMSNIDNWTMSAWLKPSQLPQFGMAISLGYDIGNPPANGYAFGLGTGGVPSNKLNGLIGNKEFQDPNFIFNSVNDWNHVIMQRKNGITSYYVNGKLLPFADNTSPIAPTEFLIGSQHGIRFFNGKVDDVRLYTRAINAAEVQTLYKEYCDTYFTQQPLATLTGTTLSVNTYAGANYQWSFNNLSVSGATSPVYLGTKSAGLYTVTVTNAACVASASFVLDNDIVDLDNGLTGWYPFNNSPNDISIYGNNGTLIGGGVIGNNNRFIKSNSAYSFTPSSYINLFINSPQVSNATQFTFSTWIKPNSVAGTQTLFTQWAPSIGTSVGVSFRGLYVSIFNGKISASVKAGVSTLSDVIVESNKWQLVNVVFDGNKPNGQRIWFYVNGTKFYPNCTSAGANCDQPTALGSGATETKFGTRVNNSNTNFEFYSGLMDATRFYNRALNDSEIATLYSEECPGFSATFNYGNTAYPKTALVATPTGTFTGGYFIPQVGLNINTATGVVNPSASSPGVYNVTYFVPAQYGCTSLSGTASITIANEYQTGSVMVDDCSTKPFYIPVITNTSINGIYGLDVAFQYNANVMSFTGNYLLGDVVTATGNGVVDLTVVGNNIQTSIAYSGDEGTISGIGNIISYEFILIPGTIEGLYTIPGGSLVESYYTSSLDANIAFGVLTVQHYFPVLNGKLIYREDNTIPIINNTVLGSSITIVKAAQNCIPTGTTTGSDLNGNFGLKLGEFGYSILIDRWIISSTSGLMGIINGMDANMAGKIANGKISNPSAYELISADVNNDGRVTSGDKTLINKRTTLKIAHFPAPDWKFIPPYLTFTGFDKNNVPKVPACVTVPSFILDGCVQVQPQTYRSILIGDIDGNYTSVQNGQNLRLEAEAEVTIDLTKAVKSGEGLYKVPVFVSSESEVSALDMDLDFKPFTQNSINVALNKFQKSSNIDFNLIENKLLVTSDYTDGLDKTIEGFAIEIKAAAFEAKDFTSVVSYVNGKKATTIIKGARLTSIENELSNSISVYPVPSEGLVNIDFGQIVNTVKIEVTDLVGHAYLVSESEINSTIYKLDLSSAASGVYIVKLIVNGQTVVKRIVVE